ncbi:hypothetical protein CC1G_12268 [Coprinopsis cinerea okayama7|uniref:C2H2-type domain-containing protein n=1 Tax=Coprinopsis cinerea (strain Okayama-7 / 130 / ATCC MYA-4618 / FGSC 9003) TaxID=240176 RepID=A8NSW9_COPC7|nr:hypothetical protein CC1G_12268 [Coprinopsis cinerea okayama7\|eukprot:XP_001836109.1 hypothetical protein CC1G_12268 [Coprinopsis cinerea okayama7\
MSDSVWEYRETEDEPRLYHCPAPGCTYSVKTKRSLVEHMRQHQPGKGRILLKCPLCPFVSTTLRTHRYTAHPEFSHEDWVHRQQLQSSTEHLEETMSVADQPPASPPQMDEDYSNLDFDDLDEPYPEDFKWIQDLKRAEEAQKMQKWQQWEDPVAIQLDDVTRNERLKELEIVQGLNALKAESSVLDEFSYLPGL